MNSRNSLFLFRRSNRFNMSKLDILSVRIKRHSLSISLSKGSGTDIESVLLCLSSMAMIFSTILFVSSSERVIKSFNIKSIKYRLFTDGRFISIYFFISSFIYNSDAPINIKYKTSLLYPILVFLIQFKRHYLT